MILAEELVVVSIVGVGLVTKFDVVNTVVDSVMEVSGSLLEFRQAQSSAKAGHHITELLFVSQVK